MGVASVRYLHNGLVQYALNCPKVAATEFKASREHEIPSFQPEPNLLFPRVFGFLRSLCAALGVLVSVSNLKLKLLQHRRSSAPSFGLLAAKIRVGKSIPRSAHGVQPWRGEQPAKRWQRSELPPRF